MVGGVLLGFGLALLRLSRLRVLSAFAWTYIWFIRGTPQLLQLVFLYDALPSVGIRLDSFTTAVIGFALNEAAFSAEIIRGGILSVNRNQAIAAAALGMGPLLTMRRIILPQAMRAILPAMANDSIAVLKGTSIASVIFVNELTFRSQQVVGQNFKFFTVFAAAGVIYLALTSAIAAGQWLLERTFNIELERPAPGTTTLDRLFGRRPAGCECGSLGFDRLPLARNQTGLPTAGREAWLGSISGALSDGAAPGRRVCSVRRDLEGVRRPGGGAGHRSHRQPRRSRHDHGAKRQRQKHAPAVDQSFGATRQRRDPGLGRAGWLPTRRWRLASVARSRKSARQGAHRHGVPALQPFRSSDGPRKRHRSANSSLRRGSRARSRQGHRTIDDGWPRQPRSSSAAPFIGRSATTGGDRARSRHFASPHAVR